MVVAEAEIISQAEVDSSADHHRKEQSSNHAGTSYEPHNTTNNAETATNNNNNNYSLFPNLGRQSSIYSLTLDEFQHTLCENGKNFGSMNMDEFLNSIWTAEENQAHHHNQHHNELHNHNQHGNSAQLQPGVGGMIAKQQSLSRQGSLSLPAPLCRKTVDEVWSEIQRSQHPPQQRREVEVEIGGKSNPAHQRQPTFGEMTLEDFLVKAGVVREQAGAHPTPAVPPAQHPHAHAHQYGYANPGAGFVAQPMMGGPYPGMAVGAGGGESAGYLGNGKRSNGYPAPAAPCYGGGRVSNNGGGVGFGAPVSPVSPEGLCGPGQVDNPGGGQYGMDMGALRGRKRMMDGPVEMVVERRQRRMIKNRESAARSRARKQAYTVELEAELNQLREENTQLKQALAEIERQRKQQYVEEQRMALSRAQRAQEKLKTMRRSCSCNL